MEKLYKVLKMMILVLSFAVILVGASVLYNRLSAQADVGTTAVTSAEAAPDFTVYDAEGNAYRLSDFEGTPVVLNFWASWCGPCTGEMPEFQSLYEEYGDEVQFLMVNMTDGYQETLESAASFITEKGYTFPVFYDTESSAAYAYSVYAIPSTYFIDAEGNILSKAQGALNAAALQKGIDLLIG